MAYLRKLSVLLVIIVLLYIDLAYWQNLVVGLAALLAYIIFTALSAFAVLVKFFYFSERAFRAKLFAAFCSLTTTGFFLAAALLLTGRLSSFVMSIALFIHSFLCVMLEDWAIRARVGQIAADNQVQTPIISAPASAGFFRILVSSYLFLAGFGFLLLYRSKSGASILTPWQTIGQSYIYVFAFATLALGLIIHFAKKAKYVLLLLSVHALLLYSYIPLTHELLYGADQWRHMAVENAILNNEQIGKDIQRPQSWVDRLNFNDFSYAEFWGTTALFSKVSSIDTLTLNKWLGPIMWAVIFPALLFELALTLGWSKRAGLWLAWAGFLPFAFQAGGSFTLPSSWGFLWWLLLMILIIKRLRNGRREQIFVLAGAGVLSLFGYGLYFFLFWAAWLTAELMIRWPKYPLQKISAKNLSRIVIVALILFIPLLDIITGYSRIGSGINLFGQIKQMLGNFTGWYIASGPRPHDIATGNVFFNQMPSYSFVRNIFISWTGWVVPVMMVIFAAAFLGWSKNLKSAKAEERWLAIVAAGAWGGYVISRYFLQGEQVVARRMDAVLALTLIVLAGISVRSWLVRLESALASFGARKIIAPGMILLASFITAGSYSLGPDTRAVSTDEYAAMRSIWQEEMNSGRHCVLAETYPLLALQAISGDKIKGGGFPMGKFFSQTERTELYEKMLGNAGERVWKLSLEHTLTDKCWFVTSDPVIETYTYFKNNSQHLQSFGDVLVWRYDK
ncbi:MAG: hypothetical protein UX39_C0009G0014 [Candidatus Magasanikbacteria bacterium GW2011_GWA2_46_17]|uniref:Glycosyltransferase RgtA/B/C/D-like domain-containing protein n=1 Tax=Candidatus Magasanikbacteria bacterium GW2011_GWA2_46_17 TaxID=1619042 RepID=A0A0G1P124_9BACT|nr:MAG: hypothetical protein UX39_C0009G0014 [Candidatus Magasanikbacteria bacterium GW2011_GWA2_46_17]